jgi:hypothetical protein
VKQGRSLTTIAAELERQVNTRKDFIAPQGAIEAQVVNAELVLNGLNGQPLGVQPFAHRQFADHLGIPQKYYDRMKVEQPQLLAQNLNTWLKADGDEKRMVRTLDGRVRAFLSPKYRPLDNFDLASAVLPTLMEKGVQVLSAELTETRLYIKGILPALSEELPDGLVWGSGHVDISRVAPDLVIGGDQLVVTPGRRGRIVSAVTISNSEVGAGTLRIEPSVFTAWCSNMAALVRAAMKKYHVGRAGSADDNFEVFHDDTRKADDKAFWLKVRDVTQAAFDEQMFKAAIAEIAAAGQAPIVSTDLQKVVDVTVRQLALPVSTAPSILSFLARGGDLSKWGLSSAVTAVANTFADYEGATQLEHAGGEILALDGPKWEAIASA